jgi:hypothetical protein
MKTARNKFKRYQNIPLFTGFNRTEQFIEAERKTTNNTDPGKEP